MSFGEFGGQYVPQELKVKLNEIEMVFNEAKEDPLFIKEYLYYLKSFVGRPSPLFLARNITKYAGGAKIYLKREDLNHTGAHKINNAVGQILLAKRMRKTHHSVGISLQNRGDGTPWTLCQTVKVETAQTFWNGNCPRENCAVRKRPSLFFCSHCRKWEI